MILDFLQDAVTDYKADRVEVPDALLRDAQAVIPTAAPYRLAPVEHQALSHIVYLQGKVVVGVQKL